MILKGTEDSLSLKKLCLCCDNHGAQAGISLVGDDLVATDPSTDCGENLICLKDLWIPITGSFKFNKKMKSGTKFLLEKDSQEFKFLGIHLDKNKSLLYRFIRDKYSAFFNFSFDTKIDNITKDIANITINTNIDTNVPSVALTWQNISTTLVYNTLFTNWQFIHYTWQQISAGYLSNYSVNGFTSTNSFEGNLYRTGTTEILENTYNIPVTIGKYKLNIELYVKVNSTTTDVEQTIKSVTFISNNVADLVIFDNGTPTKIVDGNSVTINTKHLIKFFGIIDYMTLIAFLTLSSSENMDDIEFWNNSISDVSMCLMGAY